MVRNYEPSCIELCENMPRNIDFDGDVLLIVHIHFTARAEKSTISPTQRTICGSLQAHAAASCFRLEVSVVRKDKSRSDQLR